MLKWMLICVFWLLPTTGLGAQRHSSGLDKFAGASWGTTLAAFRELHPEAKCNDFDMIKGDEHTQCVVSGSLGSDTGSLEREPVVAAMFYDGKLEEGTVEFLGVSYPAARDLLVERYGKPSGIKTERLQNAFGAVFSREVLTWKSSMAVATLQEWQSSVGDDPRFWVYSSAALQRAGKHRAEEKARAKGKF